MVSFGFCLWQGGTRRPAIGDLRVMRRSEDAIQALRPSEPPPRAGGRNEEPQPPHGQGGASRPAIWTRRESQLNNCGNRKVFASRDAPPCSWDDRGSRRRVLRCTAPRMAISGKQGRTSCAARPAATVNVCASKTARTFTPACVETRMVDSRCSAKWAHFGSSHVAVAYGGVGLVHGGINHYECRERTVRAPRS